MKPIGRFMYLDRDDLLSIADTSKNLKPTAKILYARKFDKNYVLLREYSYARRLHFLRLLRCFGHLIIKLEKNGFYTDAYLNQVYGYILEYCSKSLVELSLYRIPEGVVSKPFLKVETLRVLGYYLGAQIKFLSAWFPALRSLDLNDVRFTNSAAVEKHFPHLEELIIFGYEAISSTPIGEVLRLNPQLRNLILDRINSPKLFQNASKYLSQLDFLELSGKPNAFCGFRGDMINFKTVNKLILNFWHTETNVLTVFDIKFSFDRLEDFTLHLGGWKWNSGLTDFIQKHQTITKLTLETKHKASKEHDLTKIVRSISLLVKLTVFGSCFSVDKLIGLINRFDLVKYCLVLEVPK